MANTLSFFGPGPAKLPAAVLQQTAEAVLQYRNTGLSILELPHRSAAFREILAEANSLVQELCGLGDDFEILWLQGGGRLQFAMVPANFLDAGTVAAYIDSGHWASDAFESAKIYGQAQLVSSSREKQYRMLPSWPAALPPQETSYLHLTPNNTIYGTQWADIPDTNVPLVADLSSDIFSRPRDYSRCSLFYAVAQKNLGAAGVTLVAIRKDFLKAPARPLPPYLSYAAHVSAGGILNTLPVFSIYVCLLYLRWLREKTLAQQFSENKQKAAIVYEAIDRSKYFCCQAATADRSLMNVVFRAENEAMEKMFLEHCRESGLEGLEGHRSTGGFRASLYNAVSVADAAKLATVIRNFKP